MIKLPLITKRMVHYTTWLIKNNIMPSCNPEKVVDHYFNYYIKEEQEQQKANKTEEK